MTFLCFLEAQYPIFRHFFRDLYEIMLFITNPANLSWNLWKIVRFEDILRLDILRPFFWAAQKFLSYNRFLRKQSGPIRTQSALRLRQFIWDCICRTVWRVDFFQLIFSVDFFSWFFFSRLCFLTYRRVWSSHRALPTGRVVTRVPQIHKKVPANEGGRRSAKSGRLRT